MKTYYAAENHYGSATDIGFVNTWYVLAFESKQARDKWVSGQNTLSARAIRRAEVTSYMNRRPKPFTKEYFGISTMECGEYYQDEVPEGLLGKVGVIDPYEDREAFAFYGS